MGLRVLRVCGTGRNDGFVLPVPKAAMLYFRRKEEMLAITGQEKERERDNIAQCEFECSVIWIDMGKTPNHQIELTFCQKSDRSAF